MVRRQALTLLACLLQEDYVKWRGSLFFRFVSSLVDPKLKRFGEFCLVHLLLARQPTVFYQHFIECVFHFNGYEKHKGEAITDVCRIRSICTQYCVLLVGKDHTVNVQSIVTLSGGFFHDLFLYSPYMCILAYMYMYIHCIHVFLLHITFRSTISNFHWCPHAQLSAIELIVANCICYCTCTGVHEQCMSS